MMFDNSSIMGWVHYGDDKRELIPPDLIKYAYVKFLKKRVYNYLDNISNIDPDIALQSWTANDGDPIKKKTAEYIELNYKECTMIVDGIEVKGIRIKRFECIDKLDQLPITDIKKSGIVNCVITTFKWVKRVVVQCVLEDIIEQWFIIKDSFM